MPPPPRPAAIGSSVVHALCAGFEAIIWLWQSLAGASVLEAAAASQALILSAWCWVNEFY